jgi:hypothetical protein
MKIGDLVEMFGISVEVEGAVGAGYSPCKGCDLKPSSLVPACYCANGRKLGCAGEKYGDRLPAKVEDAVIFTLQPCNLPEGYFEKVKPPRYWKQVKALPEG